jgi:hypothetical protein
MFSFDRLSRRSRRAGASTLLASFAAFNLLGGMVPSAGAQGAPSLSIDNAEVTEGSDAVFKVTVSGNHGNLSVDYETRNDSAVAGSDYIATSGTLNILSSESEGLITVPVVDDNVDEPLETFKLKLLTSSIAISDDLGVAELSDNDPRPALIVRNAQITEGDGAIFTNTMTFDVELTNPSNVAVTVDYTTVDGTAVGHPSVFGTHDYLTRSGNLSFAAETNPTLQIAVPVKGDSVFEGNEQFEVVLSNQFNANLRRDRATGTIDDNETKPRLAIESSASATEGDGGFPQLMLGLDVTLSGPSDEDVVFTYSTFDGTAHANDYGAVTNGSRTIPAGSTSGRVFVAISGDTRDENDENFFVTIVNPPNANLGNATAEVTILDDD